MGKLLKSRVFFFILGAIIFSGITGVVAADLASSKVAYDNTASHSSKTTVQDAIDDLYDKADNMVKVYNLGTGTSFDIKTLVPDVDYTQLTEDNFIVGTTSGTGLDTTASLSTGGTYYAKTNGLSITKSYNASTGILSVSVTPYTHYFRGNGTNNPSVNWTSSVTVFAYVVIGQIN